jgi:EF-P beta-lysylation protein EpmB
MLATASLPADWQNDYRAARITMADLLAAVGLTPADLPYAIIETPDFPLKVPPHTLSLIRRHDPFDPILLQILARTDENTPDSTRKTDALDEENYRNAPGILQKYHSRALILASGACAIHCRYCFRRHTDYGEMALPAGGHDAAIAEIAADSAIEEVILSGGDPLSLTDPRLATLLTGLAAIPHITTIRLHSRTATSVPSRITPSLVALLAGLGPSIVLVTHTNHAQELDETVAIALAPLRRAGVTLLNQSVLLAGINDSAPVIAAHARRLLACGVLPYYMHLGDAVVGTGHFDVPLARALALEAELRDTLPGYLVPRFVREVPGRDAKTPAWQLDVLSRAPPFLAGAGRVSSALLPTS